MKMYREAFAGSKHLLTRAVDAARYCAHRTTEFHRARSESTEYQQAPLPLLLQSIG